VKKTNKFATAINCIDGRVQVPLSDFIKANYNIDYVDMITVPGPDKVLSGYEDANEIESIRRKVLISCDKHDSRLLFIAAHYDCAGNPCDEKEHLRQVKKAIENVEKWNINSEIFGLWIDKELRVSLIK